jgi:K+-transporting ATPase KdpF subunit
MIAFYSIIGVIVAILFIYLFTALLKPELFP